MENELSMKTNPVVAGVFLALLTQPSAQAAISQQPPNQTSISL
jgi:hypothetical protein